MEQPLEAARRSGLVREGEPLLVMLSGGGDSVCLLDVALRLGADVSTLHVDHGLRADSGEDADFCRALCERLGVELAVERVELAAAEGPGNLQAAARDARYELAERHARGDYATAHTASDQAETVLYRLAVSPGRRALLGMAPRRGRLVRPLLAVTRDEVRDYCRERGLEWREDPSNEDLRFARARVRAEVLPALRALNPAAERTIAETAAQLREEAEVLEELTPSGPLTLAALRDLPTPVARLALRAESETHVTRADLQRVLALPDEGTHDIQLQGGVRAIAEYGSLRFARDPDPVAPEPVPLPVPGEVDFGFWHLEASVGGEGDVLIDPEAARRGLVVRGWRPGDRIRPVGLGGTKTLQDLFTDRKVPRAERASVPVVEAGGRIAWVAGLAVDEDIRAEGPPAVALTAHRLAA